jgi:mannose-1-phosphate guanylyltransferase
MDEAEDRLIRPVILCGGAGTRLWPLSRAGRPKQLLALTGAQTMLQMTAARVADAKLFAPPVVVAAEAQAPAVEEQLGADRIGELILEPAARNTAPAIALAAIAGFGARGLDRHLRDEGGARRNRLWLCEAR